MNRDKFRITTDEIDSDYFRCWWQWGGDKGKQGVVDVRIPDELHYKNDLIAEINAIHYLFEELQICGYSTGGELIDITCSFKEIEELAKGLGKNRLYLMTTFLRARFSEANFKFSKSAEYRHPKATNKIDKITAKYYLSNLIKDINGELFEISQHAFSRLMMRWNMGKGEEEKAWRKIMVKFNDEHVYEYEKVVPDPDFIERYFYNEKEKIKFITKENTIVTIVFDDKMIGMQKKEVA